MNCLTTWFAAGALLAGTGSAVAQIESGAAVGKEIAWGTSPAQSVATDPSIGSGVRPAPRRKTASGVQLQRSDDPVPQVRQPNSRPNARPPHPEGDRQYRPEKHSVPPSEDPAFRAGEVTTGRSAAIDQAESTKEVLVIEEFGRTRDVPVAYMMTLRDIVAQACIERGRHEVADATMLPGLGRSQAGILYGAADDPVSWREQRMEAIARSGARYVIMGMVSEYKVVHARTRDDKEGFKSAVHLVLTGYDLATATQLETRSYNLVGEGVKADQSDQAMFNSLRGQLIYFLDSNFEFETEILQIGAAKRRGKIKECYIHAGTRMGVRPGDLFLVYEVVPMRGVATRQPIGKLRVKRADDTDSALCAISKGGEEIARAMQAGSRLIVVSDSQALF